MYSPATHPPPTTHSTREAGGIGTQGDGEGLETWYIYGIMSGIVHVTYVVAFMEVHVPVPYSQIKFKVLRLM